jgi:hypothetical protein
MMQELKINFLSQCNYTVLCTANKIIIIMALQPFVGPWPLFQFLDLIQSRYDYLDGGSARRKASTYTLNNINTDWKHIIETAMPSVGFEATIPASERTKTVNALDRAATVIRLH